MKRKYAIIINAIQFAWDEEKNRINKEKHEVTFDEAKTVFYDIRARIIDDPDHSEAEERFVIIGLSNRLRILVVSHCFRDSAQTIRIISARKATRTERKWYEQGL